VDVRRLVPGGMPVCEPAVAPARAGRPFHVGVLMDNLPAFVFAELGCGLAGAALVGLNPTRTGGFLARDLAYADCQLVIVEPRYSNQLQEALDADPSMRPKFS